MRNPLKALLPRGLYLFFFCLFSALLQAEEIPYSQGLLFKIQLHAGPSSYLFGTIHSDDERVLKLPLPVNRAFAQSQRLVVEARMEPAAILASVSAMLLSNGKTLPEVIGQPLYRRSVEAAKQRGIPEIALRRYKPWAVAILLSVPPSSTGQFLDLMLFNRALSKGKPIDGLETLDEQLGLFDKLSPSDQRLLLTETLNNIGQLPKLFQQMHEAYLRRDLGALVEMNQRSLLVGASASMSRFQHELIEGRNQRMVERLQERLRQGGLFIAVGALHLPGSKGMLNLLKEQGYGIERIY